MTPTEAHPRRRAALAVALAAAVAVSAADRAAAAPVLQTSGRIVVVGYPDLVGTGPQPGCAGCDRAFGNGDSVAASAAPLPLLDFVLRDDSGTVVDRRMTSALADGRRPASFPVAGPGSFSVELVAVPDGWSICPNDTPSKSITAADFDADGRVQLDFYFWRGCVVAATPTATAIGGPTAPVGPTPTPRGGVRPTLTPRPGGMTSQDDQATAAPPAAGPSGAGEVRGLVYIDLEQDGVLAADDPGLGPVVVRVTGEGRSAEVTTPIAGTFTFANLPAGTYVVTVAVPNGYRLTTAGSREVAVAGGVTMGVDFGLFPVAGLQSLPVPPRTGPPPRLPLAGGTSEPANGMVAGFAALIALLGALGFTLERRAGVRS
jgi:hypothetical protein